LYDKYHSQGFEILAFPCNQFGNQEPGTEAQIKEFVSQYGVSFPMFSKINVNGDSAHPLFVFLRGALPGTLGDSIKWNFTKFLCDANGIPKTRYATTTEPYSIEKDIVNLLNNKE